MAIFDFCCPLAIQTHNFLTKNSVSKIKLFLKDFGINSLEDLVKIFDRIRSKIVDPIVNAVKNFKKIIENVRGKSFLCKHLKQFVTVYIFRSLNHSVFK